MSTGWALILSVLLLAGNAFFVAAEFALVASKGYRLEQAVDEGRRGARAALAGTRELSLMLAGAQLGITLCTLGLGALAEPALAHVIDPVLHATGLPAATSYLISFVIALAVVVSGHMIIGEMAPKSWAISHPERSALLLAPPFRAFTRAVRPVLAALNAMANGLLRLVKVQPQDQLAQAHGPEELSILLEQSREHGTLEANQHELLDRLLRLRQRRAEQVMRPIVELVTVAAEAGAGDIERICLHSGRSRLAVTDPRGRPIGLVHVRDAIRATTAGRSARADELMMAPFWLGSEVSLVDAVALMREHRAQLAIIAERGSTEGADGHARAELDVPIGFVALEDLLEQVIGDFDDETDLLRQPVRPPGPDQARVRILGRGDGAR
jgi:magnesium and cobalt exporter, CNNM family